MYINKIHVSSFGKLKDYSCTLNNGLNTIKEENGFGKTTLSFFIKSIFYGLEDSTKNISTNERKKYQPWGTSNFFGGYIDFTLQNKKFRIERYFGKKQSEDSVKLIDLDSMKEFDSCNLGERIFHIDGKGFISTCFFAQNNFANIDDQSVITKFNNICENNTSNTFLDAYNLLDKESKKYIMKGEKGKIFDDKREYYSICQTIDSTIENRKILDDLKEKNIRLKNEIQDLSLEIQGINSKREISGKNEAIKVKKEKYNQLLTSRNDCIDIIEQSKKKLNGNILLESDYENYIKMYEKYNTLLINNKTDSSINKKTNVSFLTFLPIFLVFVSIGIIGVFVNSFLSILGFLFFAVSIITFLFLNNKKSAVRGNVSNNDEINKIYSALLDVLLNFGVEDKNIEHFMLILGKIKDISIEYKRANDSLLYFNQQISTLEQDNDLRLQVENIEDYATLSEKLLEKQKILDFKKEELSYTKNNIYNLEEKLSNLDELEIRKNELKEIIEAETKKYNLIIQTLDLLNKANDNLKGKYREPLELSLNKYVNNIIDENLNIKIDTDLNIFVEEKGSLKQIDYFSKGYQDLFEISKRFALIDVLFSKEKPFVILDDVFNNLDDKKLIKAMQTIKNISSNYQIIYFVCHESRSV